MPLYQVTVTVHLARDVSHETRMISAPNQAKALAYVVKDHIVIAKLGALDALKLADQGVKLESVE